MNCKMQVAALVLVFFAAMFSFFGQLNKTENADFTVDRGQITFDAEGQEGGPYHSRTPHVPSDNSGLTLGRGYDMSKRTEAEIEQDLLAAGMLEADAKAYKKAFGLKGKEARDFIAKASPPLVEITTEQQKKLFAITYEAISKEVKRLCNKADTVETYGKVDWDKLDRKIKDILIDLKFRGDYTTASRKIIQRFVANNDFVRFREELGKSSNWTSVPKDRFQRRSDYLNPTPLTDNDGTGGNGKGGGKKGLIKLPKGVPGWVTGNVKDLNDIEFTIPNRQSKLQSVEGGYPVKDLTLSPEAIALLKGVEGLRLDPYDDQTGKKIETWVEGATIGYGHLITQDEWSLYKDGITESDANALFLKDLAPFEDIVRSSISVGLQQYEYDALVILAFNIGPNFANSSVVKLINDPKAITDFDSLESAWKAWNKSQGKVNKGLINRRQCEWQIFTNGIYKRW